MGVTVTVGVELLRRLRVVVYVVVYVVVRVVMYRVVLGVFFRSGVASHCGGAFLSVDGVPGRRNGPAQSATTGQG